MSLYDEKIKMEGLFEQALLVYNAAGMAPGKLCQVKDLPTTQDAIEKDRLEMKALFYAGFLADFSRWLVKYSETVESKRKSKLS